jgi:hypothetical protein
MYSEMVLVVVAVVAIVLQHIERAQESSSYLSPLLDNPPPPYTDSDITILCALAYHGSGHLEACKEGDDNTSI